MIYVIYEKGYHFTLLDLDYEIIVGRYDTSRQAQHGWDVYMVQGRIGEGFEYTTDEEILTDIIRRRLDEDVPKIKLKYRRETCFGSPSSRSCEIQCRNNGEA